MTPPLFSPIQDNTLVVIEGKQLRGLVRTLDLISIEEANLILQELTERLTAAGYTTFKLNYQSGWKVSITHPQREENLKELEKLETFEYHRYSEDEA